MNKISNFHSSLYILNDCHESIERLYFIFSNDVQSRDEYYKNNLLTDLRSYIIMEVSSFIDEYQIYFAQTKKTNKRPKPIESIYVQRIKNLHEIIEPILDTINRWTNIREYRNNYVAHKNRSSMSNLKISSQEPYDAPRKFFEVQLLRDLIHIMFGIISQEFKIELTDAFFFAKSLKSVMNPGKDNSNIKIELQEMVDRFNKVSKQQGKAYTLNISTINYEPLKKLVESFPIFFHPLTHTLNLARNISI